MIKIIKKKYFQIILILVLLTNLTPRIGFFAEEETIDPLLPEKFSINLDQKTIAKGYTVAAFADSLKLSLVPGILSAATRVEVFRLNEEIDIPWQLDRLTNVYQFEFNNKQAYDNHKPFYIQFAYDSENSDYKQVFFYDKNYHTWRPLPTKDFPREKFVRSLIHLPFARIAVFSYPDVLADGRASWYSHKAGMYAASPDFPKDSRLRVFNKENGKYVDVTINDYGPDRSVFPDRAIDLEKEAFARIASLSEGMAEVVIEPLYIAPDSGGNILGIEAGGARIIPEISAKAGIVYSLEQGKIVWQKNSTTTLPLASLTKMVAVKVFLDTKPSLNTVVAYSEKDAEYNYQYCQPWESAKLNVEEGETMTIEDLIYASLVGSANNTVETLVRISGRERNEFIALMNSTVLAWGASSTEFSEPTGLSPENVSSALDYAIITSKVIKSPIISKATTMDKYTFSTQNTQKKHTIKNTNRLILANKYKITSSKTGYLDEAGYCLMTSVKNADNSEFIIITLGADERTQSFFETEKLIKYSLGL